MRLCALFATSCCWAPGDVLHAHRAAGGSQQSTHQSQRENQHSLHQRSTRLWTASSTRTAACSQRTDPTRSKLGIALLALGISLSAMAMDLSQPCRPLAAPRPRDWSASRADGYLGVWSATAARRRTSPRRSMPRGVPNTRRRPTAAARWPTEAMAGKRRWKNPCRAVRPGRRQVGEEIARRLRERSGALLRSQGRAVSAEFSLSRAVPSGTPAVFHGFCDRLSRKAAPRGLSSIIYAVFFQFYGGCVSVKPLIVRFFTRVTA